MLAKTMTIECYAYKIRIQLATSMYRAEFGIIFRTGGRKGKKGGRVD